MTTETITCTCGTSFPWDNPETDKMLRDFLRPHECPACEVKTAEKWKADTEARQLALEALWRKERRARIQAAIPSRFRQTDRSRPDFNLAMWESVKEWKPTEEVPFLGFIGESGACKSRIAYLLFERLAGVPSFAAKSMTDLSILIARQFHSFEDKTEARDELDNLRLCELLLLDDLGKAKNTPSVAVELFSIIDHRHAHNLPTIWTANGGPDEIVRGMNEDIAGPLAGRLIECSIIVLSADYPIDG